MNETIHVVTAAYYDKAGIKTWEETLAHTNAAIAIETARRMGIVGKFEKRERGTSTVSLQHVLKRPKSSFVVKFGRKNYVVSQNRITTLADSLHTTRPGMTKEETPQPLLELQKELFDAAKQGD